MHIDFEKLVDDAELNVMKDLIHKVPKDYSEFPVEIQEKIRGMASIQVYIRELLVESLHLYHAEVNKSKQT